MERLHPVTRGKETELIGLEVCATWRRASGWSWTRDDELLRDGPVRASSTPTWAGTRSACRRPGGRVRGTRATRSTRRPGPRSISRPSAGGADRRGERARRRRAARQARIIGPDDQRRERRGRGQLVAYGAHRPRARATPPAGSCSARRSTRRATGRYPPHKHDTHEPPREVRLEEVYLFKLGPAQASASSSATTASARRPSPCATATSPRSGSGYHPVVAAPGYALYYFWVMAGEGRQMTPRFDPHHAWVQTGMSRGVRGSSRPRSSCPVRSATS